MTTAVTPIWRRVASVALVVAGFGVLYWYFWVRPGDEAALPWPTASSEMFRFERPSDSRALEDDDLVRAITGSLSVDGGLVEAASCVAGSDWLGDSILNPDIVVATDPSLVRAAELYDDAIEAGVLDRARVIADTEQQYWVDADIEQLARWAEGLDDDEVRAVTEEYLGERAEPPSPEAERRFIVYVAQIDFWSQGIFYLDGARLKPSRIASPSSQVVPSDQLIAGLDEMVSFPLRDCDEVARGWGRYDPDLPELPPIEDRWQMETGRSGVDA